MTRALRFSGVFNFYRLFCGCVCAVSAHCARGFRGFPLTSLPFVPKRRCLRECGILIRPAGQNGSYRLKKAGRANVNCSILYILFPQNVYYNGWKSLQRQSGFSEQFPSAGVLHQEAAVFCKDNRCSPFPWAGIGRTPCTLWAAPSSAPSPPCGLHSRYPAAAQSF